MRGAQRAATLTQRLLAFSRRQPLEPEADRHQPAGRRHVRPAAPHARREHRGRDGARRRPVARRGRCATSSRARCSTSRSTRATPCRTAASSRSRRPTRYLDDDYAAAIRRCTPGQYVVHLRHRHRHRHDAGGRSRSAFEPFFTTKDDRPGHRPRPEPGLRLRQAVAAAT